MTAMNLPSVPGTRRESFGDLVSREKTRAHRRRALVWSAVASMSVVAVAGWFALRPRPVPISAQYRMQPVTQGDVLREVRATGHVEAVTTVQVGAEISGRIASVDVDFNERVKEGQVLARFDRASLAAQLAQADAALAGARASLEQTKTERERVTRDLARIEKLHEQKAIADAEYDNAKASVRLAEQRTVAAEAQVAAQQAIFSVSRTSLDHSVIRSPINGVVITRNVDPGQTVAAMFQTPVLFTVAADLRRMRVIAAVDEADVGEVAVQQGVTFTVNAYPDRIFEGRVTEVRSSPVVVQDIVTYGAVIEVDNLDFALKPGMTATAHVRTASAKSVLRVPASALRFAPPGEKNTDHPGVWVLDGAVSKRVDVRPGISDGELVEIASGGLALGQPVLVELTPEGRKAHGLAH